MQVAEIGTIPILNPTLIIRKWCIVVGIHKMNMVEHVHGLHHAEKCISHLLLEFRNRLLEGLYGQYYMYIRVVNANMVLVRNKVPRIYLSCNGRDNDVIRVIRQSIWGEYTIIGSQSMGHNTT